MRFKDYFSNEFGTGEQHHLPSLRTRYYRCRIEQAMDAVKKIAETLNAKVDYIDYARHEVIFETRAFTATATLVSPTVSETAVDWNVSTYKVLPLGKGKKVIEMLYKKLDGVLPFKDVSLYRER